MALSAAQVSDLVDKAKILLNIRDDDDAYHEDALAVWADSGTFSSATVEVTSTHVNLVDNVNGTTAIDFSGNTDLSDVLTEINAVSGWTATLLTDSEVASNTLVRKAATSVLGQTNELTLVHENQELLELLIVNLFDAMETELGRNLISASITEKMHVEGGTSILTLSSPEVSQVTQLSFEVEDGLRVEYTGSDTHARVEVTDTAVIISSRAGATTTSNTLTFAANVTTTAMASAVSAVADWTGTVVNDAPSAFLVRQGVRDATTEQTLEAWVDWDGEYEVEYAAGNIMLRDWPTPDRGYANVIYTAGYANLPADLEQVLLSLVKEAWDASQKDSSVTEERIGDYAYKLAQGSSASISGGFQQHEGVLSRYRRVLP